jgi:hypothetical protein
MTPERLVSFLEKDYSTAVEYIPATAAVQAIKSGKWRNQIEAIRHCCANFGRRSVASTLKHQLPAIAFSGTLVPDPPQGPRWNRVRDLVTHSGLICADIDNLAPAQAAQARKSFAADPHCFAFFSSPTATGLKAVFAVEPDGAKHRENFFKVRRHVASLRGLAIDSIGEHPYQYCYVSDDPEAYLNPEAVPLP